MKGKLFLMDSPETCSTEQAVRRCEQFPGICGLILLSVSMDMPSSLETIQRSGATVPPGEIEGDLRQSPAKAASRTCMQVE